MGTDPARDQLSSVFDLVEVRGIMTGALAARGPWRALGEITQPLKFFIMGATRTVACARRSACSSTS